MDIKATFETLAAAQIPAWKFEYSRRDYQNLLDSANFVSDALNNMANDETIFFCDPITRGKSEQNVETFEGSFMVLTRSDHDESYSVRYTKFIEPLIDTLFNSLRNKLKCEYDIKTWRSVEVINMLDWNADGLLITYRLEKP